MTLETETYVLNEEIDALEDEKRDLAEAAADLDPDNPAFQQLSALGSRADQMIDGLQWATDQWDIDEVTLGGLTAGEQARVEDRTDNGETGRSRILTVATGSVSVPAIPDTNDPLSDDRVAAASALPHGLVLWLEQRISDLTQPGGNGDGGASKSFEDLVVAERDND